MTNAFITKNCLILLAAVSLGGCVSSERSLYSWDGYQPVVYQYYQAGAVSPQEQIAELEKSIEAARSQNLPPPPGFYAHLGMLQSSIGNIEEAYACFRKEKQQFPESAPFMDFLLSKSKGRAK